MFLFKRGRFLFYIIRFPVDERRIASPAYVDTSFSRRQNFIAKVSFYHYKLGAMSENTCYVNWLIGVETGRLLGDQQ